MTLVKTSSLDVTDSLSELDEDEDGWSSDDDHINKKLSQGIEGAVASKTKMKESSSMS
jgi:hypothetical protein